MGRLLALSLLVSKKLEPFIFMTGLLLSQCVTSEQALYNERDLYYVPQIEGKWVDKQEKGSGSILIQKAEKGYLLIGKHLLNQENMPHGKIDTLALYVIKLNDDILGDISYYNPESQQTDHIFLKLVNKNNHLLVYNLDSEELFKMMEKGNLDISHVVDTDKASVRLTATADEIQAFLTLHVHNAKLFTLAMNLEKSK